MKRNNWTNQEVIDIIQGCKLVNDEKPEIVSLVNSCIDNIIETFMDFERPSGEFGALARLESGEIVHIGKIPE